MGGQILGGQDHVRQVRVHQASAERSREEEGCGPDIEVEGREQRRHRRQHGAGDEYPPVQPAAQKAAQDAAEAGGEREGAERPADKRRVGGEPALADEPERDGAVEGHQREVGEDARERQHADRPDD